jgi:hypothetical protein
VTRWVCEKIAPIISRHIFVKIMKVLPRKKEPKIFTTYIHMRCQKIFPFYIIGKNLPNLATLTRLDKFSLIGWYVYFRQFRWQLCTDETTFSV